MAEMNSSCYNISFIITQIGSAASFLFVDAVGVIDGCMLADVGVGWLCCSAWCSG